MAAFGTRWRWGFLTACAGAVLLLLGTFAGRWPSEYFTLLRVAVCGVALCLMVIAYEEGSPGCAIFLGLTAFLFNPLLPIRVRRPDWPFLTIGTTVLLTAAALRFRRPKPR